MTPEETKIDIVAIFEKQRRAMAEGLEAAREIGQPSATGSISEVHWTEFLTELLPARYAVSKGLVIDSSGSRSHEIDIIIHDRQYTPRFLSVAGYPVVPAESVYAVLEVKQSLNRETLRYAGAKAASVRGLDRTSAIIPHAGGTFDPKEPHRIAAGILCTDSGWKDAFGAAFHKNVNDLPEDHSIQIGCALVHGAFVAEIPDGSGVRAEVVGANRALPFFQLRLTRLLQAMGTVPAIDLEAYESALLEDSGASG